MTLEVSLMCDLPTTSAPPLLHLKHLVSPGDEITEDPDFMRGHGTFGQDKGPVYSSYAGVVERTSKLLQVKPVRSRYDGQIGDVVVGRIVEVQQNRWKVDTNSKLYSTLMLSSVNLPGGELRRKSHEDELKMREYLQEGDLISAEVQMVFQRDGGSLSLHTRSLKYGKLGQGVLVKVSPSLVKPSKTHFHNLACGASMIIGRNGYIWIAATVQDESKTGGFIQNLEVVPTDDRLVIARLRNCVLLLAEHRIMLYDTTILHAFRFSQSYEIRDLLRTEVCVEIAQQVRLQIEAETVG